MSGATLEARYQRARGDRLGAILAAATAGGVQFRWAGADLQVDGLERLPLADQILLARHLPAVIERLAEPGDDGAAAAIAALGVRAIELVTDPARAAAVVLALPGEVGLDVETEAAAKRPWLAITRKGLRAKHQPRITDKAGLDPRKAKPRLVQVYDPSTRTVLVFDLHRLLLSALSGLWDRRLWVHNSGFESAMLGARGVALPDTVDTLQMAGLLLGCARGSRKIETVCREVLEVTLDKGQQLSDWSAPRLSRAQVNYAAIDAAAAFEAGQAMLGMMDERLRRCFQLQNNAVGVVSKMRLAGAPFAREVHLATIERWEIELAEKRAAFVELTGEEPPARHKVGAWLEAHLPPEELAWMPRTQAGVVSARGDLLKYLAHHAEVRPLLRMLWARKRLEFFGAKLLELIDPETGRIYPDYLTCGAKTGRLTSSSPNAQQLPPDARAAVRAAPGRRLIRADLDQIELRVFAEEANEQVMREIFATGGDVHRRTATSISGAPEQEIGKHDPRRKAAKAVNFGIIFAAGPRTIRASAWSKFDVDMTEAAAAAALQAVLRTYPAIRPYQQRQADLGRSAGVIFSRAGRPLRRQWEKDGVLKYTTCSNFPVQSSAADLLLRSMVLLDRELAGFDAQLILSVHDELVVEAAAEVAEEVELHLVRAMTRAFSELYPDAPTTGLVETHVGAAWDDADEDAPTGGDIADEGGPDDDEDIDDDERDL